jgi:hypothetical protein
MSSKPFLVHCKVDKWEGKQVEGNAKQGRRAPLSDHCLDQCHLARCDVAEMKGIWDGQIEAVRQRKNGKAT